jgi:hypothetical protein
VKSRKSSFFGHFVSIKYLQQIESFVGKFEGSFGVLIGFCCFQGSENVKFKPTLLGFVLILVSRGTRCVLFQLSARTLPCALARSKIGKSIDFRQFKKHSSETMNSLAVFQS